MNFQDLKKVETADFYVDLAFRRATKHAEAARMGIKGKSRVDKSKEIELEKLASVKDSLSESLGRIIKSFPSIDDLPEFYKELINATLDYENLKKSLGAVNSANLVLNDIFRKYNSKMRKSNDIKHINILRREYYGRVSSIPKRIKNQLLYLEHARKIMKDYPSIKTGLTTVAIAGFPNVGKSTLLSKITSSKPEIKPYAFTTKGINVGYMEQGYLKIQVVDTPGTLNRFEKMNYIEKVAYLAMKYVAMKIIYIFDPTEEYSLDDQEKLFSSVKKMQKPLVVYISKADIADKEILSNLKKKHPLAITDPQEIKKINF